MNHICLSIATSGYYSFRGGTSLDLPNAHPAAPPRGFWRSSTQASLRRTKWREGFLVLGIPRTKMGKGFSFFGPQNEDWREDLGTGLSVAILATWIGRRTFQTPAGHSADLPMYL